MTLHNLLYDIYFRAYLGLNIFVFLRYFLSDRVLLEWVVHEEIAVDDGNRHSGDLGDRRRAPDVVHLMIHQAASSLDVIWKCNRTKNKNLLENRLYNYDLQAVLISSGNGIEQKLKISSRRGP
jgi:hypothetical protein